MSVLLTSPLHFFFKQHHLFHSCPARTPPGGAIPTAGCASCRGCPRTPGWRARTWHQADIDVSPGSGNHRAHDLEQIQKTLELPELPLLFLWCHKKQLPPHQASLPSPRLRSRPRKLTCNGFLRHSCVARSDRGVSVHATAAKRNPCSQTF